jgi:hypothetical protein
MSIQETREELIDEIQENISILAGGYPIKELGETYENLCFQFQGLGICNLLTSLEFEDYCRNLLISAYCRRFYLRKSQEKGNGDDLYLAISRTEAFFDAIAAGSFVLANEIVNMSPTDWIPDGEYEDDFCYYAFMHRYIELFADSDVDKLNQILDRFEKSLGKGSPARLSVCRALLDKDQGGFEKAFSDLLVERETQIKSQKTVLVSYEEPRKYIFTEGLALLEIAKHSGITVGDEYNYCPAIAVPPPTPIEPEDIFQILEKDFKL